MLEWRSHSRDLKTLTAFAELSKRSDPIVLVDADDVPVGVAPKLEVHRRGLKHRALSVLVRNPAGEMLVHRRHAAKYHSGGLWTNACCSHPRPGEPAIDAAKRRLAEEMGIRCELTPLFTAQYRATVSNGFIEDELVHVFGATYEGPIEPDSIRSRRVEVDAVRGADGGYAAAAGNLHHLASALLRGTWRCHRGLDADRLSCQNQKKSSTGCMAAGAQGGCAIAPGLARLQPGRGPYRVDARAAGPLRQ